MSSHSESDEHLSSLEWREVVTYSYSLETFADVFHKAGLLECIDTESEACRKVGIMKILNKVHRCVERRVSMRILLTSHHYIHFPVGIVRIVTFYTNTC